MTSALQLGHPRGNLLWTGRTDTAPTWRADVRSRRLWLVSNTAARLRLRSAPAELSSLHARCCADAIPRGTRRPLPQRDHCLGDLAGRRIGDRSGSFPEDEQPCPGDLARDRLAVANGEERVPAAVDDERGDLDLG